MAHFDSKVNDYIANSADFAQPILEHWRQLMYDTCPDRVEAVKWNLPHFDYKGDFMCVMTAAKSHCSFTFIKAELMSDARLKDSKSLKPVQRFLGKITKLADLPSDEDFITLIKEAMDLNEKGIKVATTKSDTAEPLEIPDYFAAQLAENPAAKQVFENQSRSFRKDYIVWITAAKTEVTRQNRIEQSLAWIAEGKRRFWQFQK